MSRTVLATLGLGFVGAACSTALTGVLPAVGSGLAAGVAGNLATDLFKKFDRGLCERFIDGWSGIDENHHIVSALRLSALNALRSLSTRFTQHAIYEYDRSGEREAAAFSDALAAYLVRERDVAVSKRFGETDEPDAERDLRAATLRALPDGLQEGLADRHRFDGDEPSSPFRKLAEAAVLAELAHRVTPGRALPDLFLKIFLGDGFPEGWFDLFVRDAAVRFSSEDGQFEKLWNAEQTALIRSIVVAARTDVRDLERAVGTLGTLLTQSLRDSREIRSAVGDLRVALEEAHADGRALQDALARLDTTFEAMPSMLTAALRAALGETAVRDRLVRTASGICASTIGQPARCLGRDEATRHAVARLGGPDGARTAILFGGPGIGKSTLAREISTRPELVARFGDRRYLVDLRNANSLETFRDAARQAAGAQVGDAWCRALESIAPGPFLVVLDNLESAWDVDPLGIEKEIVAALAEAPGATVLATFRGMQLPASPRWQLALEVGPLTTQHAKALFLDIAPRIDVTDPDLDPMLALLGGIPLAIELIAYESSSTNELASVHAEWRRVGPAIARRRGVAEARETSFEQAIEFVLASPRRHLRTTELLSCLAWLEAGAAQFPWATLFAEDGFAAWTDAVSTGLVVIDESRFATMLPPVREFFRRSHPIRGDLLLDLAAIYVGRLRTAFATHGVGAFDDTMASQATDFARALLVSATRLADAEVVELVERFARAMTSARLPLSPAWTARRNIGLVKLLRACMTVALYASRRAWHEQEPQTAALTTAMAVVIGRYLDYFMMSECYRQLRIMEDGLAACDPDVRDEVAIALAQLRTAYDDSVRSRGMTAATFEQITEASGAQWQEEIDVIRSADETGGAPPGTFGKEIAAFYAREGSFETSAYVDATAEVESFRVMIPPPENRWLH